MENEIRKTHPSKIGEILELQIDFICRRDAFFKEEVKDGQQKSP